MLVSDPAAAAASDTANESTPSWSDATIPQRSAPDPAAGASQAPMSGRSTPSPLPSTGRGLPEMSAATPMFVPASMHGEPGCSA